MNIYAEKLIKPYSTTIQKAWNNKDWKKLTLFYGRLLVIADDMKICLQSRNDILNIYLDSVENLTYKEFMNIYPIKKRYDGKRWGGKDYFYTINYLKTKNLDLKIENDKEAMDLIFAYVNDEIRDVFVSAMMVMTRISKRELGINPLKVLFEEEKCIHDSKGNIVGVTADGKVHKVASMHKPKLKVIK